MMERKNCCCCCSSVPLLRIFDSVWLTSNGKNTFPCTSTWVHRTGRRSNKFWDRKEHHTVVAQSDRESSESSHDTVDGCKKTLSKTDREKMKGNVRNYITHRRRRNAWESAQPPRRTVLSQLHAICGSNAKKNEAEIPKKYLWDIQTILSKSNKSRIDTK